MRCKTAFVLPPKAIVRVIAFLKAAGVIISRGLISCSRRFRIAGPTARHSAILPSEVAGVEELPGRVMPIASAALAIVLAVYIPPHAPAPGQAWRIISKRVFSSIFSVMYSPYDWNAETISIGALFW